MTRHFPLSCLLALLGTANVASAQAVSFRGKVEDLPGPPAQFFVATTNTLLTSVPPIDLNAFVGQQVLIDGMWNGSATSPSVQVQSIVAVAETFEIGGNGSIGGQLVFAALGSPGATAVLVVALQQSFVPIPGVGVAFIDVLGLRVVGNAPIPITGRLEISVPIPNDPIFVGLSVGGQAGIYGPGIATITTNPDRRTIN